MVLTLATLTTAAGIVAAATAVMLLVELAKKLAPSPSADVSGARLAFAFSLALYVFAGWASLPLTPDGALLLFTSWLGCAVASVGIHSTASHVYATANPPKNVTADANPPKNVTADESAP